MVLDICRFLRLGDMGRMEKNAGYIFHQDTFLKDGNCIKSCQEHEMEELEAECIMEIYTGYIDSFYEEMKSAFSIWSEELTNKQISFVKKYYGDWK